MPKNSGKLHFTKFILCLYSLSYGFTANVRFTFKCFYIRNPLTSVSCQFFSTVFVLAYLLRIFEVPYYHKVNEIEFDEYFNSIWCIIITMTTVGYGDVVPHTPLGKFVNMLTALFGTF